MVVVPSFRSFLARTQPTMTPPEWCGVREAREEEEPEDEDRITTCSQPQHIAGISMKLLALPLCMLFAFRSTAFRLASTTILARRTTVQMAASTSTTAGDIQFAKFVIPAASVFYRGSSFGFVNLRPIVPGHVLIVPERIVPLLSDLTEDEYQGAPHSSTSLALTRPDAHDV